MIDEQHFANEATKVLVSMAKHEVIDRKSFLFGYLNGCSEMCTQFLHHANTGTSQHDRQAFADSACLQISQMFESFLRELDSDKNKDQGT